MTVTLTRPRSAPLLPAAALQWHLPAPLEVRGSTSPPSAGRLRSPHAQLVEQVALQNQKSVSFNRSAGVDIYTAKVVDLTGTVIAADDVLDNTDFYKGIFQSYFVWCADYSDGGCNDFRTEPDPSEYSGFSYGYMNGPLGFTWGINWAQW